MSNVDTTTGSASGGGDQPPKSDTEYESDELRPIEDDDEEETANETDNPPKTIEQSLLDGVRASVNHCDSLQVDLTNAETEAASLKSQIDAKTLEYNRTRNKQSAANKAETEREAATVLELKQKWVEKRKREDGKEKKEGSD